MKEQLPNQTFESSSAAIGGLSNIFKELGYHTIFPVKPNEETKMDLIRELKTGREYPRFHILLSVFPDRSHAPEVAIGLFHMDKSRHVGNKARRKNKKVADEMKRMILVLENESHDVLRMNLRQTLENDVKVMKRPKQITDRLLTRIAHIEIRKRKERLNELDLWQDASAND